MDKSRKNTKTGNKMKRPVGITILGILQILISIGYFIIGIILAVASSLYVIGIVLAVLAIIFLVFGAITIALGIALLIGRKWSWILAIVGSVLDLFIIPIGTVLGVIMLVYLTRPNVKSYFYRKY